MALASSNMMTRWMQETWCLVRGHLLRACEPVGEMSLILSSLPYVNSWRLRRTLCVLLIRPPCKDGSDLSGSRLTVQFARGSRQREPFSAPDRPHPRPRRTAYRMQITGLPGETSWQVSSPSTIFVLGSRIVGSFCLDLPLSMTC